MENEVPKAHRVIRGENLTSIAKKYGFPSYKPIALANGLVNEEFLKDGQTLIIPRSKGGYESSIRKLEQLKLDMISMSKNASKALDLDKEEFEKMNSIIDITCEILTMTVKTIGVGVRAARSAHGIVSKMPIIKKGIEEVSEFMVDKSIDSLNKKYTPNKSQDVLDYTYSLNKDKWKLAYKYGKEGLKVLDFAEILVSYIKPSKVAWFLTQWAAGGESEDVTESNARKMIEATKQKALINLNSKIQKLRKEKHELYDNPMPMAKARLQLM